MPVITYADVGTAIGRPITDLDEQAQVSQWITDVEMLISTRLDDWGLPALTSLNQPLLKYVVREAVIARLRYRESRNSARGDGSDETDSGEENYFLRILDPWWALLSPTQSAPSSAYSVQVTSPLDVV